jgi:hypothetical protein
LTQKPKVWTAGVSCDARNGQVTVTPFHCWIVLSWGGCACEQWLLRRAPVIPTASQYTTVLDVPVSLCYRPETDDEQVSIFIYVSVVCELRVQLA